MPCYHRNCQYTRARSYFCERHNKTCSLESCHLQAQEGLGDSLRCLKHKRCQSGGCSGFASTSGESSQWSSYCERHKCRHGFCGRQRAEQPSRPEAEPYGLCAEHLQRFLCAADCDPPCYNPARNNGQDDYCSVHSSCNAERCRVDRRSDSSFCDQHKCNRMGCPQEADPIVKFCPPHRCVGTIKKRGKYESCKSPTVNGPDGNYLIYCAQHCCQYNFREDRLCVEYNENQSYCKDHRCTVEDCNHARSFDIEDDSLQLCPKHMKRDSGVGVRPAMPGGFFG